MKIIFFGTPLQAAHILEELISAEKDISAVVTRPDKPKGRGLAKEQSPVALVAEKNNIKTLKPEKLSDKTFFDEISALRPDIGVVVAYGKILPKELLTIPKNGFINIHASLLPKYRGASPIQAAILNGEQETGVTIMQVGQGLDTGNIIAQVKIDIGGNDDFLSLSDKLFKEARDLIIKTLKHIENETAKSTPQDDSKATHAPLIKKEDGLIDFNKPACEINNKIRAFVDWPGAYIYYKGKKLKILKAQVIDKAADAGSEGAVLDLIKDKGFVISCAENLLLVEKVQPENSKVMTASEFVHGYRVAVGDRFGE